MGIHKDKRSIRVLKLKIPGSSFQRCFLSIWQTTQSDVRALCLINLKIQNSLGWDSFYGNGLNRQKMGQWMICERTHGRCHLDGNQMRINLVFYCCVCRKHPSVLQRKWLYLGRWNQETVFHFNSGSNVCVFQCEKGTDWSVAPILVCLRTVLFSWWLLLSLERAVHFMFLLKVMQDHRNANNIQPVLNVWGVFFVFSWVKTIVHLLSHKRNDSSLKIWRRHIPYTSYVIWTPVRIMLIWRLCFQCSGFVQIIVYLCRTN